jgi:hypothetical protein
MNASIDYTLKRREYLEDLKTHLNTIKSFKEVRAVSWAQSIRSSYLFIAIYNLLLDESSEAKKYFFKGAKITCETFSIFKENRYPNLIKKETPPFTALFVNSFLDAILCDSEELLMDYARTIEDMGMMDPPFNYEITYAMKYLVLENFEKAKEHAVKAHQPKYFKLPYKGFSHVVMGILEKNVDLVNEGIALRLKHHERENKNSIFYSTSIEATALAKLAIQFGLSPDISSAFINKALLQKDTAIQYEGIDEILNALQEADEKNNGFLNWLAGWFK